jgi:hypothetical protein
MPGRSGDHWLSMTVDRVNVCRGKSSAETWGDPAVTTCEEPPVLLADSSPATLGGSELQAPVANVRSVKRAEAALVLELHMWPAPPRRLFSWAS